MNSIEQDIELALTSKYCDIIIGVLSCHKNLSINKLIFFTYLIKKNNYIYKNVYKGSTKNDIVLKCISIINGHFEDYCENIKYIITAVDILIKNSKIDYINGELFFIDSLAVKYNSNLFVDNAIKASKEFSERQFLKEVLKNV